MRQAWEWRLKLKRQVDRRRLGHARSGLTTGISCSFQPNINVPDVSAVSKAL